ncbi:MAG: translation initiation factor IF-3 [Candidatus Omnitrophica bacterium]|nr:translation initiation factor IF-3 [Candidatus Omnitrophota bacterium]
MAREARINYRIRVREVRLIDHNGEQMGVVPIQDALKRAQEAGLDLVEVAAQALPPVCRIMDYSKYKYDQEKKQREAKKKQHIIHTKELKLKPNIEEHDYQVKLSHLKRFLERGDKTKITMIFRGRETQHMERGRVVLEKLMNDIAGVGEVEEPPTTLFGRTIVMTFRPKLK